MKKSFLRNSRESNSSPFAKPNKFKYYASKHIGWILLFLVVGLYVIPKSLVTNPVYLFSEGERVGVIRKISKKGLLFKTWEGELMMNAGLGSVKLDTFSFSVVNDSIAQEIINNNRKEVILEYKEYVFMPWRVGGEDYLITGIKQVNEQK